MFEIKANSVARIYLAERPTNNEIILDSRISCCLNANMKDGKFVAKNDNKIIYERLSETELQELEQRNNIKFISETGFKIMINRIQ